MLTIGASRGGEKKNIALPSSLNGTDSAAKCARLEPSCQVNGYGVKKTLLLFVSIGFLTPLFSRAAITDAQGGGFIPDETIVFKTVPGKVTDLKLHLFFPEGYDTGKPYPAIVLFFGGGWNGGTAAHFFIQAQYLASRGMVTICPDYRTRSSHGVLPYQCVEDGKAAMRYVRQHAGKLGIDPNRIAAGGGSAGGHVAAATATLDRFDVGRDLHISCVPNALVLFNPVYDNGPDGYGYDRVKDYWEVFSPMHNIDRDHPPTIVLLGDEDNLVPVSTAEAYQQQLQELGIRSELHVYPGAPHGFFNWNRDKTPDKELFVATLTAADSFLASLGFLEGKPNIIQWVAAQR